MRIRKLIGLVLMLALIVFYALIVMTVAVTTSVPENGIVEFFYYLVTGVAWVVPAAAIIYWMQRPDEPQSPLVGATELKNVQRDESDNKNNDRQNCRHFFLQLLMVGAAGFEPTTPCPPDKCATGLRYAPT